MAKNQKMSRTDGIDAALKAHHLDALVALSGGPASTTDLVNGDHDLGSARRRRPSPGTEHHGAAGEVAGLPVGVSFFSTA